MKLRRGRFEDPGHASMQSKQPHSRRCERGVPAEDAALRLRGPCALASNRLRLRSVPRLAGIDGYEETPRCRSLGNGCSRSPLADIEALESLLGKRVFEQYKKVSEARRCSLLSKL